MTFYNLIYITTPHSTTGIAPTQLFYNRKVRTNIPSVNEEEVDYKELHIIQARMNTEKKQSKAQEYTAVKR